MNILFLLPLAWGAVTTFVVAACRVASLADARLEESELGEFVGR